MTAAAGEPLTVWSVTGVPEIRPGDDLAELLLAGLTSSSLALRDGDVLVVSSKVVSKALGLVRAGTSREDAVAEETVRPVARRRSVAADRAMDTVIVQGAAGPVMAAAGVDSSNVRPGQVLLLPADADEVARALRSRITTGAHGVVFGLVIADTAGRPWRDGVTDFALGAAGVRALEDLRGRVDTFGTPLEVTVRAIADEVAGAADLVKGKLSGVPAALVSGLAEYVTEDDGPGAVAMLRGRDGAWWQDWFRYGHVEAVRAALQAGQHEPGDAVPAPSTGPEAVAVRANRALLVALSGLSGQAWGNVIGSPDGAVVELSAGSSYAMGAATARLHVALWSEHLATSPVRDEETQARFAIRELVD